MTRKARGEGPAARNGTGHPIIREAPGTRWPGRHPRQPMTRKGPDAPGDPQRDVKR
ncbi:hypothetical protein EASAB2608_00866 [Streptomyces sp. EAS-AB2608]|nr:hypothetical protein EASAB2608_00866 [Streptomyces sp. EAS-AB2608]